MTNNIVFRAMVLVAALIFLSSTASATAPIANAGSDQTVYVGDTVTFSGASSSDDGSITGYFWNFADGSNATGVSPTHVYSTAASYGVTLTVLDNQGLTDQDTVVINVRAADSIPPTITHTAVTSASAGSDVSITATITDTNGIYSAILYYRVGSSGNYTQLTMSATGDVYSAAIPQESVTTAGVQYYIEAKDSSSTRNVARSPSDAPTSPTAITVTAADSTPPSISHTATTSATANTNISINATITDTSGIDTVTLYYRVGTSGNYTELTMSASGDVYSATIPRASVTTSGVQYYILAIDASSGNNNAKSPSTAPTTPNTITVSSGSISMNHTAVTSATVSNAITITATITGSVRSAQLYYKVVTADTWINTTMTNSSTTYTASISSSYVVYDGVQYYLKITDSQGSITYSPTGAPTTVNTVTVEPPQDDGNPNYVSGTITNNGTRAPAGTSYRVTVTSGTNSGYYYVGTVDDSNVAEFEHGNGKYSTEDQTGFSTGATFRITVTGYSVNATGTFNTGGNTNVDITQGSAAGGNVTNLSIAWNSDGSIGLSWNGTASTYDIYTTTNYTSGFGTSPNFTVSNSFWNDSSAASYSQRYYRVAPNGSTTFNQTVGKFDLALRTGMNLVSLPLIPENNTLSRVLHQNATFYPITQVFDRQSNGQYRIATFYTNNPPDYWWSSDSTFTNLSMDKGYWFKVSQNYNLTIVGSVPSSNRSITLTNGMNLMGWSTVRTAKFWTAISQNVSSYNVTQIFDRQSNGQYRIATFYTNNPPNYWWSSDSTFDSMEPGKGYWFKVTGEYTWSYNP